VSTMQLSRDWLNRRTRARRAGVLAIGVAQTYADIFGPEAMQIMERTNG
jgi:hypothetical protein